MYVFGGVVGRCVGSIEVQFFHSQYNLLVYVDFMMRPLDQSLLTLGKFRIDQQVEGAAVHIALVGLMRVPLFGVRRGH